MSGGNPYTTLSAGTLQLIDAIIEPAENLDCVSTISISY